MARLTNIWENLRTSFWFVPTLMVTGAILLLIFCIALDRTVADHEKASPFVYVSTPGDAREVLATLLSSMITMASLVFSVTMVVLSLAANQFGPRLIRSFMASPQTQTVLGAFVMTIVYCLLLLAKIGSRGGEVPTAYLSVTVALVLTLISVGLLVFFIHTLARSIVSETVIARVGRELAGVLDGYGPCPESVRPTPETHLPDRFNAEARFFGTEQAGYVQAIEFDEIAAVAKEADVVVGLAFRSGDYVAHGGRTIGLWPAGRCDDRLTAAIQGAIVLGIQRTPVQDIEFSIRHLVEIAVRALSAGVNDPYTAAAAIDQLSASLSRIMECDLPSGVHRDSDDQVRVVCPAPSYASLLGASFDQIRQNGVDKPMIAIRLIDAMARIGPHVRLPVQLDALGEQLRIVAEAASRTVEDPSDQADVARRVASARTSLADAARALAHSDTEDAEN